MKKQNINKTSKIKKNLLLTSIGAFAIASSTIAISAVANSSSSSSLNKNVISSNNGIATLSLTNNSLKKDALVNPNELIWMSENLNSTNTSVVNDDGQPIPENITKWENFFERVSSLEGNSSIKDEILAMKETLDNVVDSNTALQNLYQTYNNLRDQYPNLTWPSNDEIKENFLQENPGVVLDMSQIPGINDIKSKLLELSGIVEGSSIATISSNGNNIETNLTGTNGSSTININNYAGEGYTQLIKIAEISASTVGNYALEFEFRKDASSLTAKGVLYIKNDNNQIQSANSAAQLYNQLDIFGRKTTQSNGATLEESFTNFVIQKNASGNLEIMVRINDNQTFTNMKFRTDIAGASNLKSPEKFGILDVQATNEYSFVSKINGNGDQGLLINNIEDTNLVKEVQFFSETLSSNVLSGEENEFTDINEHANRKLTFYQVGEFDYSLPLWIANNSKSEATSNIYTYEALTNYENGTSTGVQKELTIISDTSGAQLSENTYSLYEGLKEALPDDAINGFPESSIIILESFPYSLTNSDGGTYLKNEITFFDHFYAIGQRVDGYSWNSVNRGGETKFIAIVDPTQKIFLEKPQVFSNDEITTAAVSTLTAEESVNERTTVIKFLGHIYNEFSKTNGGEFAGQSYSIGSQTLWNASGTGTNISPKTININNVNAYDIYNLLNNYWKGGSAFSNNWYGIKNIFNNLFSVSQNENKYDGTVLATAQNVVENVLAKTNEFTSNTAEVERIVQEAINIVKGDSGSIDSSITYENLDQTKKNELAKKLVELIKFQFGTISNEFDSRQYEAVYSKLKDVINDNNNTISIKINTPSIFLETLDVNDINIFKYKEGTIDQISVSGTVTLKESLKTVFDLLYFQNSNIDQINLGSSIFNSDSSSLAFETLDSSLLTSFESANETITTRKNVVLVYSQMLSLFVSQNYNFSEAINKMLESGQQLSLGFDLKNALNQLIAKISSANKSSSLAPANTNVQSYCLDDIISGTNAIICLNWKLNQLLNGTEIQANKLRVSTIDLINQINSILENIQVSPDELATWSNILTNDGYNFSPYTEDFSGRNGQEALEKIVAAITNDENIMKSRSEDRIAGVAEVKKWLELLWWIIIALIGVGILVSSSVGLATKERQVRLSSRPILKWLLISAIILGIAVATVAILAGVGIL